VANCGATLKILLIEDEVDVANELKAQMEEDLIGVIVEIAQSRDSGSSRLEKYGYDLIVCDLRIPPSDGGLDPAEEHGLAVYATARATSAGTPLIFLTGFATLENIREALSTGGTADLFGHGDEGLVSLLDKSERLKFLNYLADFDTRICQLTDLDIETGSDVLDEMATRAVCIYARKRRASRATIALLRGLSGATTARGRFENDQGNTVASVFFKVSERHKILDEQSRYRKYVAGTLAIGTFAPHAGEVLHNLRRSGAIFYTLAEEFSSSIFGALKEESHTSSSLIQGIRRALRPWHSQVVRQDLRVGDFRRSRISDETLGRGDFDATLTSGFESTSTSALYSVQHGDLHGENVLVGTGGNILLIDFGDVGVSPIVLDPLTLEFSLLFHSDSPTLGSGWPTVAQAERWWDVDSYLENCPVPDFVVACRAWSLELDSLSVPAVVYGHAMRQLKYPDVPVELAMAVARGALTAGTY